MEPAAIADLYSRFWRVARAAAYAVTADWTAAEDAASEAFRQAIEGLDSLRDPERFAPWLRTIAVRVARKQRVISPGPSEAERIAEGAEPPDRAIERAQLSAMVRAAVECLPEALREAVALHYFEGYSASEAARFLEIPPGSFRRRLHDARARIRVGIQSRSIVMNQASKKIEIPRDLADLMRGREVNPALLAQARQWLGPARPEFDSIAQAITEALPAGWEARRTHALLAVDPAGDARSLFEVMQRSPEPAAFRQALEQVSSSQVLDATGAAAELRDVQALLEGLASATVPNAHPAFGSYTEPRYRAALAMRFEGHTVRAAIGGVLTDGETGVIRIFLENWAALRDGERYSFTSVRTRWASESPMQILPFLSMKMP